MLEIVRLMRIAGRVVSPDNLRMAAALPPLSEQPIQQVLAAAAAAH
jgi:hypothetical protein